jgi:hypothetical protein
MCELLFRFPKNKNITTTTAYNVIFLQFLKGDGDPLLYHTRHKVVPGFDYLFVLFKKYSPLFLSALASDGHT